MLLLLQCKDVVDLIRFDVMVRRVALRIADDNMVYSLLLSDISVQSKLMVLIG